MVKGIEEMLQIDGIKLNPVGFIAFSTKQRRINNTVEKNTKQGKALAKHIHKNFDKQEDVPACMYSTIH